MKDLSNVYQELDDIFTQILNDIEQELKRSSQELIEYYDKLYLMEQELAQTSVFKETYSYMDIEDVGNNLYKYYIQYLVKYIKQSLTNHFPDYLIERVVVMWNDIRDIEGIIKEEISLSYEYSYVSLKQKTQDKNKIDIYVAQQIIKLLENIEDLLKKYIFLPLQEQLRSIYTVSIADPFTLYNNLQDFIKIYTISYFNTFEWKLVQTKTRFLKRIRVSDTWSWYLTTVKHQLIESKALFFPYTLWWVTSKMPQLSSLQSALNYILKLTPDQIRNQNYATQTVSQETGLNYLNVFFSTLQQDYLYDEALIVNNFALTITSLSDEYRPNPCDTNTQWYVTSDLTIVSPSLRKYIYKVGFSCSKITLYYSLSSLPSDKLHVLKILGTIMEQAISHT